MTYEQALKERYAEGRRRLGAPVAVPASAVPLAVVPEAVTAPVEPIQEPPPFVVTACVDVTPDVDSAPIIPTAKWKTIMGDVARKHKINVGAMLGTRRDMAAVYARQELAYRLREECGMSWKQIGGRLGGKDHTTALHGYRRHQEFLATGVRLYNHNGFKRGVFWTEAKVQEAVSLRASGLKMQEIADAIGATSASAVSSRLLLEEDLRLEERLERIRAEVRAGPLMRASA